VQVVIQELIRGIGYGALRLVSARASSIFDVAQTFRSAVVQA
jgi:hypothetical protein